MSIDHLKKQAKNLKKALPDFLKQHPSGVAPLAEFQELIARASGYQNWHTAIQSQAERPNGKSANPGDGGGVLNIRAVQERIELTDYTSSGEEKAPREFDCVLFTSVDHGLLDQVTSSLDRFLDEAGTKGDFGNDGPPAEYSKEMAELCRRLIRRDSSFVDGYAHLANALFWLGENAESIRVCRPVFDQMCALMPSGFKGRIPYHHLENRPFHRLAHSLVLAYYELETAEGNKQALSVAKQMLKWWPNDNIGFRFLLSSPEHE